jgi:hypothetical protein
LSKTLMTKLYLKEKWYGLKMQEGSDFVEHIIVFNQGIIDLGQRDVIIDDEDKAIILICSLPPSYESTVTTLTFSKEYIKIEEITATLLAQD